MSEREIREGFVGPHKYKSQKCMCVCVSGCEREKGRETDDKSATTS